MNILEARRRLLGAGVYKKAVTGNPAIAQGSLARMYPGIEMQGWTEQKSTTGANLIDYTKAEARTESQSVEIIDGGVKWTGDYYFIIPVTGLKKSQEYTMQYVSDNASNWLFAYTDGTYASSVQNGKSAITDPEKDCDKIFIYKTNPNELEQDMVFKDIMLNEGSTALPWEPYTGGQPSPNPDYPQEIVSAGNYDEGTGKYQYEINVSDAEENPTKSQTVTLTSDRPLTKWDRLVKKNGVWGWEYGSAEIVFDGSDDENWNEYPSRNGFNTVISRMLRGVALDGFCDKLIISKVDMMDYPTAVLGSNNNDIYVKQVSSYASDVDSWKTWLQSNPITVLYQLAKPVFTPLSETEQEQMNALHTNRPTTVLSNNQDCEMSLTYKTRKSMEVTT